MSSERSEPGLHRSIVSMPWAAGAVAIFLLALLAYVPAINGGFIWDDDSYVTENLLLRDWDGLRRIWIPRQTPQYYPMVFTTFWVEFQLWELNPQGYHVVNVLLHALAAVLVWRLALMLGIPWAWLIGAVFALHPVHVESVAWITERKNVLSGVFYLAAAVAYLRFDAPPAEPEANGFGRWGWYAIALALFALALLSKTVTCSLPAALILMMLWQRKRLTLRRLAPLAPMFIIGLILALHTAQVEREHVGAQGQEFAFSFMERLIIASKALLFYPSKLIWPVDLMFIYPRWAIDAGDWQSYLPVAAVVLIGAAVIALYVRGWRAPALALAFYAGMVFPALGFVNIYPMLFSFVADHFQYLASLGVIALVIGGAGYLARSRRAMLIASVILLPALAVLTWRQAATYYDQETVWRDTLSKNDRAWMPHNNLAGILLRRFQAHLSAGNEAEAARLAAEAEHHAQAAVNLKPREHTARSNLSEALRVQGKFQPAMEQIHTAIDLAPWMADYHWKQGRLHHLIEQYDSAAAAFEQAVKRAPASIEYRLDLARALMRQEKLDEAAAAYEQIVQIAPEIFDALGTLGSIAEKQGRCRQALEWYGRALEVASTPQQIFTITPRLVRVLIACDDSSARDLEKAIELARWLCEMTEWSDAAALDLLARAHAAAKQFSQAIKAAERAAAIARAGGMNELAKQIEARRAGYERGE